MTDRLLLTLALSLLTASCTGKACGEVGCLDGLSLRATVNVPEAELQASSITLCANGQCTTGTFPSSLPSSSATAASATFHDSRVTTRAELWRTQSGFRLEVYYLPPTGVRNGDVYDVALVSSGGSHPFVFHQAVAYQHSSPNGPGCAPDCSVAFVDLT
jgi:hypothetical protein